MKSKMIEAGAAIVLALLMFFMIIAFIGYKKVDQTIGLIQATDQKEVKNMTNPNLSDELKSTLKDNWTVALFGLDSRDTNDFSGTNSDVVIIASINNKTGDINLISVFRDTCLKTGDNRYNKVNESYAVGGPKKAVEVLNENLDLQIDDYVAVNWKAVATAINILGGIDINITKDELKYINGYITETVNSTGMGSTQIQGEGIHHLDGIQAVAYSRIRYTAGNDYKRTERQRTVLAAVLETAKNADSATLNNIIVTVFPMTASSIDANNVIAVAANVRKYKLIQTGGFPFEVVEKNVNKQDFVFPDTLETNVIKLHEFLYGTKAYDPSEKVKEISKRIDNKRYSGNKAKETVLSETSSVEPGKEIALSDTAEQIETIINTEAETVMETDPASEAQMENINPEDKTNENYGPGFITITETSENSP